MLLEAPFVAVVQIIVYAGAIMVLFLFVVMLLNVPREDAAGVGSIAPALPADGRPRIGAVLAVLLALGARWALSRTPGLGDGVAEERCACRRSPSSAACCSPTTCSRSK